MILRPIRCHNNTCAGVSRTHFDLAALDLEFRVHQHNAKLAQVKLSASPAVLNGKRSPILDFKSVLSANSRHGHGIAGSGIYYLLLYYSYMQYDLLGDLI